MAETCGAQLTGTQMTDRETQLTGTQMTGAQMTVYPLRSVATYDSCRRASFVIIHSSFTVYLFTLLDSKGKWGCLGSSFILNSSVFILDSSFPFTIYHLPFTFFILLGYKGKWGYTEERCSVGLLQRTSILHSPFFITIYLVYPNG